MGKKRIFIRKLCQSPGNRVVASASSEQRRRDGVKTDVGGRALYPDLK